MLMDIRYSRTAENCLSNGISHETSAPDSETNKVNARPTRTDDSSTMIPSLNLLSQHVKLASGGASILIRNI